MNGITYRVEKPDVHVR